MCVLLVEDETLIASIMSEYLMDAGYDVLLASDGLEAYRVIADPPVAYSMLVTDMHLAAGPTGLEVATRLWRRFPHLPVIVATGRPDVVRDMPVPDFPYYLLAKPYRPSELVRVITNAIGPGPHGSGGGHELGIGQ